MYPYGTVENALEDVLRLSKGMTYTCAEADVDCGGGGDSSIPTALVVIYGIQATNLFVSGCIGVSDKTHAIKGREKSASKSRNGFWKKGHAFMWLNQASKL